ncbi:hypothetical protein RVBP21_2850 [Pseudomonas phage BRkr]|nr:hypothetical protein RVBP21_2850 [Pseudomonas phage BRkr]
MSNVVVKEEAVKHEEPKFTWENWSAKYVGLDLIEPGVHGNLLVSDWYNTGYENTQVSVNQCPRLNQYIFDLNTRKMIGAIGIIRKYGGGYNGFGEEDGYYEPYRNSSNSIVLRSTDFTKVSVSKELATLYGEYAEKSPAGSELLKLLAKVSDELAGKGYALNYLHSEQQANRTIDAKPYANVRIDYAGSDVMVQLDSTIGEASNGIVDKLAPLYPDNLYVLENYSYSHRRVDVVSQVGGILKRKYTICHFEHYSVIDQQTAFVEPLTQERIEQLLVSYANQPSSIDAKEIMDTLHVLGATKLVSVSKSIRHYETIISLRAIDDNKDEVTITIDF